MRDKNHTYRDIRLADVSIYIDSILTCGTIKTTTHAPTYAPWPIIEHSKMYRWTIIEEHWTAAVHHIITVCPTLLQAVGEPIETFN